MKDTWRVKRPAVKIRKLHDRGDTWSLVFLPLLTENRKYHAKTGRGIPESVYAELGITEDNERQFPCLR